MLHSKHERQPFSWWSRSQNSLIIFTKMPFTYLIRAVLDRKVAVVRDSPVSAAGTLRCCRGRPRLRHFPPGDKEVSRGIGVPAAQIRHVRRKRRDSGGKDFVLEPSVSASPGPCSDQSRSQEECSAGALI